MSDTSSLDANGLHLDRAKLLALELYSISSSIVSDKFRKDLGEVVLSKVSEFALHFRICAKKFQTDLRQFQLDVSGANSTTGEYPAPWIENVGRACDALIHYKEINVLFAKPALEPYKLDPKLYQPSFVVVATDTKPSRLIYLRMLSISFLLNFEPAWRQGKKVTLAQTNSNEQNS